MKKLKISHKVLIALLITISNIILFGPRKLSLGLIVLYVVLLPVSYLVDKRAALSLWQERLIFGLLVYPIVYLFISASDILAFFTGFLFFTSILFGGEKWGSGEKEHLPEW